MYIYIAAKRAICRALSSADRFSLVEIVRYTFTAENCPNPCVSVQNFVSVLKKYGKS